MPEKGEIKDCLDGLSHYWDGKRWVLAPKTPLDMDIYLPLRKLWEKEMSNPKVQKAYKKFKKAIDAYHATHRQCADLPTRVRERKTEDDVA